MTDATAIPINVFENDRELMIVAPMPGVSPEDIAIEVTDAGELSLRAAMHGEGQERIEYVVREWSYGPYERTATLPRGVDATRANVSYGNGVLSITLPKTDETRPARISVPRTGHARGGASGHRGREGGSDAE